METTRKRKRKPGLSSVEEDRIRKRLVGQRDCWGSGVAFGRHERPQIHSAAWVDATFRSIHDVGPGGEPIHIRIHEPRNGPPQADTDNCRLVRCVHCGVPMPAVYVGRAGICLDCHVGGEGLSAGDAEHRRQQQDDWGASPWRAAMDHLRVCNLRIVEMPLAHRRRAAV